MCLYDDFLKKVPKDGFLLESQEGQNPHLKLRSFKKLAKMRKIAFFSENHESNHESSIFPFRSAQMHSVKCSGSFSRPFWVPLSGPEPQIAHICVHFRMGRNEFAEEKN